MAMPERLPRNVSPSARIYLRPVDIFGGAAAVAMVKAQSALPIGGGPLAFLACEVAIRDGGAITRSIATLGELGDWAARVGGLVADRVTGLLDRIASTGCTVLATGNPGCLLQLEQGMRTDPRLAGVRVCHPVELLAEAYGGEQRWQGTTG